MPIVLDGGTVDVSLKLDKSKDESTRPSFVCKYLTCRDVLKYEKLLNEAVESKTQSDINDALNKVLSLIVVGFKNIEKSFSTETLDELLTPEEKWELATECLIAVRLSELDKKKSLSTSPLAAASSAPNATAASV